MCTSICIVEMTPNLSDIYLQIRIHGLRPPPHAAQLQRCGVLPTAAVPHGGRRGQRGASPGVRLHGHTEAQVLSIPVLPRLRQV